jgi:fused signal recognition particle receptor
MAFDFIKKVFSFGRKQVEEAKPEPVEEQAALPAPEAEVPVSPAEAAPSEPTETASVALEAEAPPAPVEEIAASAPETPIAEETLPERPALPDFLRREEADETPASPSPLRGGSIGEADWGGVVRSSDAAETFNEPKSETPVVSELPHPVEPTPSGPSDHLPLKGGEEVAPEEPEPAPEEPAPSPVPVEPEPAVPAPEEPAPAPTPAEPEPAPVEPEPQPVEIPAEPAPEQQPAVPEEVPAQADEPAPAPVPVEVPTPPAEPSPEPQPAPQEVPPQPTEPVPAPSPIEVPAPTSPSPLRGSEGRARPVARPGESVGEAERGGVPGSSDATVTFNEPEPETPVVSESPSPVEPTPSGPSDHLPLKGGEEVALPPLNEEELAAPATEILPPLRQLEPIETDPLRDEIAPEPAPLPTPPPPPAPGKVTVTKKVEQKAEPVAPAAPEPRLSWFQRLRQGLSRSSKELSGSIAGVFTKRKLDEETLEELEDVLIRADLGMETALRVTDALASTRYGKDVSDAEVRAIMAIEVEKVLKPVAMPLELDLSHKPHVILVVGVNGTGKTTTIGKLAAKLTDGGLSVMLAAGDTFRAAAIEQLKIWGERTNSPVVASKLGADAAGLAFDAFVKAKEAGSDVLIIDTAGRLQNKAELMAELEKIVRVLNKHDPEAPHTVLQTVDATTGQNALNQVEIFRNIAGVNGLVMTKLDGTARGGILVAIAAKHKLPVYFIGVGEQVDDLEPFSASDFAKAIAGVA